jgi:hypothetical protein
VSGRDKPSYHGLVLGKALAALAEAGRAQLPELPDMCATCAFRPDCMTSQMAATGLTAFNCAVGVDDSPFGCHHGMKDGEPTKRCVGHLAARAAPFERLKAILAQLGEDLGSIPDPDPVRAEFDAWIARVDPDDRMDDYQRGRMWLRARLTPSIPGAN